VRNNTLQTITYSNFRCQVTPLYKFLNALKLNDIYKFESAPVVLKLFLHVDPQLKYTIFCRPPGLAQQLLIQAWEQFSCVAEQLYCSLHVKELKVTTTELERQVGD